MKRKTSSFRKRMRKIKIPQSDQKKMPRKAKLKRSYLKRSSIQGTLVQRPRGDMRAMLPFKTI
jgi:hypothetical protein